MVVLLLDVLQILMLLGNNLTPITLLSISALQSTFWGGVLLTDIVYIAKDSENTNVSGIVMVLGLLYVPIACRNY